MSVSALLFPLMFMVLLGAITLGIVLFSSRAADSRVKAIVDVLPGTNCKACGYASCTAAAEAVATGTSWADVCIVGKDATRSAIDRILHNNGSTAKKERAYLCCSKNMHDAGTQFTYAGPSDCRTATELSGGGKRCSGGCVGFGTCCNVCPADALHLRNGLPVVNLDRCTGCGNCVDICPKNIIILTENTPAAREKKRCGEFCVNSSCAFTVDQTRCISCGICFENCPVAAISWQKGTPAVIDKSRCIECYTCLRLCPEKVIS